VADRVEENLRAGLRVSQASLTWTVLAGSTAIVVGVLGSSLSLLTFGLIGLLDGIGSASLIVHFRHSQRHEAISVRHEQIALTVVTVGLAVIGLATLVDSIYRLSTHATGRPSAVGSGVAIASVVVLSALANIKHRIAPRIPSHALYSDGWVSGMGALLALVVLIGAILDTVFGLWWIDPIAAIVIACGAVSLGIVLFLQSER
jgi:divalent metal cation (Fe/Co/Zn/Cd) transporter